MLPNGAWLEWLPQETILFERAPAAPGGPWPKSGVGARLLAGEMIVSSAARPCGETMTGGLVRDAWEIRRRAAD